MSSTRFIAGIAVLAATAAGAADIPLDGPASEWEVRRHEGAKGAITDAGKGVYRIVKENAEGILEIRRKQPVELTGPRRWFLRGEYRSRRNVFGTMFFYRLVPDMTAPANLITSGSRTLGTETLLVNTPGDSWKERIYSIQTPGVRKYHPVLLVVGNPARITLRNLRFTPVARPYPAADAPDREPEYTWEQAEAILARRSHATAEVVRDGNGDLLLMVNGRVVPPAGYRNEGQLRWEYMFRNAEFHAAGVPLTSIQLPLSRGLAENGIVLGRDRYDWEKLDGIFRQYLRRTPHGTFFVTLTLTGLYMDWVRENPDEVWRNIRGEIGWGNTSHLNFFSNNPDEKRVKGRFFPWPSYSSRKWRNDSAKIIADIIRHIMSRPYGKAVAGFQFCGGDDGQFQYRNDDHSQPAQREFRRFLAAKYGDIAKLNSAWKSGYRSFDEIVIPPMIPNSPAEVPFLGPGIKSDYRMFQEEEGWTLREHFARTIKAAAGKKVVTICWGIPDAFSASGLEKMPHLDIQVIP